MQSLAQAPRYHTAPPASEAEAAIVPGEYTLPTLAMVGPHGPGRDLRPDEATTDQLGQHALALLEYRAAIHEAVEDALRPITREIIRRLNAAERRGAA